MPFYLLTLDTEKMDDLSFVLLQSPNGTPLCGAQAIRTPKLLGALRVYWLEKELATPLRLEKIRLLDGVKEVRELSEILAGIDDRPGWKWENDYILDQVFAHLFPV